MRNKKVPNSIVLKTQSIVSSRKPLATCNVICYICRLIKTIKHKGLRLFFEEDNASKLQPNHIKKIRSILTRLEFAMSIEDMNTPGARLHALSGDMKGYYAVKVSGNWRIIFRYEDKHVYDVDYLDYH